MTRPHRLDPVDGWHHVMSRGVDRRDIFFDDDDRLLFGHLLGDIHRKFGVEIHAYCLMTNHFHALVRCPRSGISDAMHHLLSAFARKVNTRVGRAGHLFGGRFESRLVETERYIVNAVRYIHRNPLDIIGINSPSDYRWSSHRHYLDLRRRPPWLHCELIGEWFDDPEHFDSFVAWDSPRPVAGSARTGQLVRAQNMVAAVELVTRELSGCAPRHLPAQRRAACLVLSTRLRAAERDLLLHELGLAPGTGAYRSAMSRARSITRREPVFAAATERVAELLDIGPAARRPATVSRSAWHPV